MTRPAVSSVTPRGNCKRRVSVRRDLAWGIDIVKMAEDEVEITKLSGPRQIGHALADAKGVTRCIAPPLDQTQSRVILGGEAGLNQAVRDPGTTHLIFFSKVASRAGADECHHTVMARQMIDRRAVVAEAGKVRRLAVPNRAHQTCTC